MLSREIARKAYYFVLAARLIEEKLSALYRSGKIFGGVFLGKGQESLSVALGVQLRKGDIYAPLIRDQAGRLAFGDTILETFRAHLGSSLGMMKGRDGNVHRGNPKIGYYPMISHLGAMVSTVAGGLIAKRFRRETGVIGATCIGDGGTSTGSFHEGINMAAVEKLPLVVVVANNCFAYSTVNSSQFACSHLSLRALGYGVQGYTIKGNDLFECLETIGLAIDNARSGHGPQVVFADLLRLTGHGQHDDGLYISEDLKKSPLGQDCISIAHQQLLDRNWISNNEEDTWSELIEKEIEKTVSKVLNEPQPNPSEEKNWNVFSSIYGMD